MAFQVSSHCTRTYLRHPKKTENPSTNRQKTIEEYRNTFIECWLIFKDDSSVVNHIDEHFAFYSINKQLLLKAETRTQKGAMSAACWPYVGLSWPMAPTPTSFTHAPVRGLLFHTRQHQTSLQTLPHTSLMHPPPRSARLPSHPYQPHRAGHAGPSLPYVGHRLDPSWRILGRCWAHVDVF